MQKDFQAILSKFYQKITINHKQPQILRLALDRYLNYSIQQEQKLNRQKSMMSGNSNCTISNYQKIKKLFSSNNFETAVLFSYILDTIKRKQVLELHNFFAILSQKLKKNEKKLSTEDKRRYSTKINRFFDQLQFLENRIAKGCSIDWLYYEIFKEFEDQCFLTIQLISSKDDNLQTRQHLKRTDYSELLKIIEVKCYIFDYGSKQMKVLGMGATKLYLGLRKEVYFILTNKQFQRNFSNAAQRQIYESYSTKGDFNSSSEISMQKSKAINRCKQQFLQQMQKLRQSYQANTALISNLFNFKDALKETDSKINKL